MMTAKKNLTARQAKIIEAAEAARAKYGRSEVFTVNIAMGSGQRRPSARELRAIAEKLDGVEYASRSYRTEVGYGLFGRQGSRSVLVVEAGLRFAD